MDNFDHFFGDFNNGRENTRASAAAVVLAIIMLIAVFAYAPSIF